MGHGLIAKDPDAGSDEISPFYKHAPRCVDGDYHQHTFYKEVKVVNECMTTKPVKVIVAFGLDSRCHFLPPGHRFTYKFRVGRFDGLALVEATVAF